MDGITTTTSDGGADETWAAEEPTIQQPQLVTGTGDTCAKCGTRLAPDQRYCVECGERRGKTRYSLSGSTTSLSVGPATSTAAVAAQPVAPRRSGLSWGSGTVALIAGVATLLLAMGVGVLIGRDTTSSNSKGGSQIITVNGGAAAPAASTAAGSAAAGTAAARPSGSSTATTPAVTHHGPAATTKKQLNSTTVKKALKTIPKALKAKATLPKCANGQKSQGNFFGSGGTSTTGCAQ